MLRNQSYRALCVRACVWLLLMLLVIIPGAAAQSPPATSIEPYTGIDVVFLVDQSGSMGGPEYGQPNRVPTDPKELRFQTMQFAMSWLGDFNLTALPNGAVRMAVISFGDPRLTTTLDWTLLAPAGATRSEWRTQRTNLDEILSADFFGFRNFGYTDHEAAFQLAQDMFDTLPPPPTGSRNLRVIVMITDGEPCLTTDTNCTDTNAARALLQRIDQLAERAFPAPDYAIYVHAVENQDIQQPYWNTFRPLWEQIVTDPAENTYLMRDSGEMAANVLDMMDKLRRRISNALQTFFIPPEDLADGQETVTIPPYVRFLRFNIFKPNANPGDPTALTLTGPDGQQISSESPDVSLDESTPNIEVWVIDDPQAGDWNLQVPPDSNVEVAYDQASISSELVFDDPPRLYQWQNVPVAPYLSLPDSDGTPRTLQISPNPQYALEMSADVRPPTDSPFSLNLEQIVPDDTDSGVGTPQYTASFTATEPGEYEIGLVGRVPGVTLRDGNIYEPLNTNTQGDLARVDIRPVSFGVDVDDRLLSQSYQWLQTDPMDVCVAIRDAETSQILREPMADMERVVAVLQDSTGAELNRVQLAHNVDPGVDCTFNGAITPSQPGDQQLLVEGYITAPDGTEREVFNQTTPVVTFETVPISYISLQRVEPDTSPADNNTRSPYPLWERQPLRMSVQAVDETGAPFDLSGNVRDEMALPLETDVQRDGEQMADAPQAVNVGTGRFQIQDIEAPAGTYTITLTGQPLDRWGCRCDYQTGQNVATATINRGLPFWIYLQAIGSVLLLLVLALLVWWYLQYQKNLRKNPLDGTLVLLEERLDDPSGRMYEVGVLHLGTYGKNKITEPASKIVGGEIQCLKGYRFEISNDGHISSSMKDQGQIRLRIKGKGSGRKLLSKDAPSVRIAECGDVSYFIRLES